MTEDTLDALPDVLPRAAEGLFDSKRPVFVGSAPGRLDVLGGIADYSGSLVLEMPLAERTRVFVQPSSNLSTRVVSVSPIGEGPARVIEHVDWRSLGEFASWGNFDAARDFFGKSSETRWVAYVLGSVIALLQIRREKIAHGWRVLVESSVPEGKGVSSSAALEVASMRAFCSALVHGMESHAIAVLSQVVENRIAGAPCGIMDQLASACGKPGSLLAIRCRPDQVEGAIVIPDSIRFWGIDSGVRHEIASVGGDVVDYTSVRVGAFAGRRMLREELVSLEYLTELTPEDYESRFAGLLPERIVGDDFLARFGETGDTVTKIDPSREYAVRVPTEHPIYENARVERFAAILRDEPEIGDDRLRELGDLMFASHESYSACGLGSTGTDRLVELVRELGADRGLFGAKITGGGSGGTVAILARSDAEDAVREVAERYGHERGISPDVFDPMPGR